MRTDSEGDEDAVIKTGAWSVRFAVHAARFEWSRGARAYAGLWSVVRLLHTELRGSAPARASRRFAERVRSTHAS